MLSLLKAQEVCLRRGIQFGMNFLMGSSLVTVARNRVVGEFLKTEGKLLFWIDSDIEFEPGDFLKTMVLANEVGVVCGAYPMKNEQADLAIGHPDLKRFETHRLGLVKITGTGLGFCCMKREIVEKLAALRPWTMDQSSGQMIPDLFRLDLIEVDGKPMVRGEDCTMFSDVEKLGYPVWLDPKISLGHVGEKVYRRNVLESLGLEGKL
jgi:hypothetical protein